MANMRSIGRLHAGPEAAHLAARPVGRQTSATSCLSSEAQANTGPNDPQLPGERPVRTRFARFARPARAAPETGYTVDSAEIMSTMVDTAPMDQAARFGALATRERLERVARRYLTTRRLSEF
jgi:hypothetical protein